MVVGGNGGGGDDRRGRRDGFGFFSTQRRRGRGVNTEVGPVWFFLEERLRDGIEFF